VQPHPLKAHCPLPVARPWTARRPCTAAEHRPGDFDAHSRWHGAPCAPRRGFAIARPPVCEHCRLGGCWPVVAARLDHGCLKTARAATSVLCIPPVYGVCLGAGACLTVAASTCLRCPAHYVHSHSNATKVATCAAAGGQHGAAPGGCRGARLGGAGAAACGGSGLCCQPGGCPPACTWLACSLDTTPSALAKPHHCTLQASTTAPHCVRRTLPNFLLPARCILTASIPR
jgi:hypothetical protein